MYRDRFASPYGENPSDKLFGSNLEIAKPTLKLGGYKAGLTLKSRFRQDDEIQNKIKNMGNKSFIAVNLFMKSATYLNVYLRQLYVHTNLTCAIVWYIAH